MNIETLQQDVLASAASKGHEHCTVETTPEGPVYVLATCTRCGAKVCARYIMGEPEARIDFAPLYAGREVPTCTEVLIEERAFDALLAEQARTKYGRK